MGTGDLPSGSREDPAAARPDAAEPWRHYALFGISIASQIAIDELGPRPATPRPDVRILRGPVAPGPSGDRVGGLVMAGRAAILEGPGVRFRIEDGATITVDAGSGASGRNMRLFLLGSAMGALLHQRGMLPLHANAIEIGGRAISFAGRSGSGKSTLAAAFHDRGHRLLADDICVVTVTPEGAFEAQPGIPRVRLWRDALERSGRSAESLDPAYDGADKYVVPIDAGYADAAVPLAAIFMLADFAEPGGPLDIRPVHAAIGAQRLIANTYRGGFVPILGDQRRHFENCLTLASRVPVLELERPRDGARLDETVERIEACLAGLPVRKG